MYQCLVYTSSLISLSDHKIVVKWDISRLINTLYYRSLVEVGVCLKLV